MAYTGCHQPAGISRDPEGKAKLANHKWNPIYNPINNPIYGPIYRAKLKKQRLEKDLQYIREHPESLVLAESWLFGEILDEDADALGKAAGDSPRRRQAVHLFLAQRERARRVRHRLCDRRGGAVDRAQRERRRLGGQTGADPARARV